MPSQKIKDALVRQSKVFSILSTAGEPLTVRQLVERVGAENYQIQNDLNVLRRSGRVRRVYVSRGQERYAYEVGVEDRGAAAPQDKKAAPGLPPDVQFDVLKASGRLRITYHGLTIEIGVSNQ
jgi:hypothetical protein